MSTAKVRVSGAWVETELKGKHRVSSAWQDFGPSGGATYEIIDWISAPALTDALDGPTYAMGVQFTVVAGKPCYGISWRVPDTITPAPSAGYQAVLWSLSPTTQIIKQAFTPVAGNYQDILFGSPHSLVPGTQYVVSVLTNRYTFRAASSVGGFPLSSPSANVVGSTGKLSSTTDPDTVPAGDFASIYYISPLVGT